MPERTYTVGGQKLRWEESTGKLTFSLLFHVK